MWGRVRIVLCAVGTLQYTGFASFAFRSGPNGLNSTLVHLGHVQGSILLSLFALHVSGFVL